MHDIFLTEAAAHDPLFVGLPPRLPVFGWHADGFSLPRGAVPLAGSISYTNQAFRWGASAYALQFHVEVRPHDLQRWKQVPDYVRLVESAGADWEALSADLCNATAALDETMRVLVERWLLVVGATRALRGQRASCSVVFDPRIASWS